MRSYSHSTQHILATALPYARSVPTDVKDWCLDQLRGRSNRTHRLEVQDAIKRLVDPVNETTIWKRMAKVKLNHPAFNATEVCMDAVTAAADWRRSENLRDAETVKANKRLQKLLKEAITLIPKVEIDTPMVIQHAVLQAGDPHKKMVYQDEIAAPGLDQYLPQAVHILNAMHAALQAVPVRHANQPFKTGAANADRTSLIMRLSANFTRQTSSVPDELVAEIVNVTMNRSDTTADTVRKAT